MHSLSVVLHGLAGAVSIVAHVALLLGPAASVVAALLQSRKPELAAIARALAAWGPDVPTFLERWRQARPAPAAPAPTAPAPKGPTSDTNRVKAVIIDAANRQCAALLEVFRQEGWAALSGLSLTGDQAADDAAAASALLEVDARWAPIWSAWRALRLVESEEADAPPSAARSRAEDEQPLAAASRALSNAIPEQVFAQVRNLLMRGGELGPRSPTLRDIDPDLTIILSARELARRERTESTQLGTA